MIRQLLVCATLFGTLAACAPAGGAGTDEITSVKIDSGPVEGITENGQLAFKGIPYAAPPVGPLRWKPPQPVEPWHTAHKADRFGNACAQIDTLVHFARPSQEEDCLTLNVFTPVDAQGKALPVMFWIHGGGLRAGSAADYDTSALVAQDVVVVTINYRLGLLGFFANPGLGEDNASANYGMLDQIAALSWVQKNIASFGGDPDNVTIFGESAGARSVAVLLAAPPANGLFDRAIMQSVGYDGTTMPLADAQTVGRRLAIAAGCEPEDATCLRALSVDKLMGLPGTSSVTPVWGGYDLPQSLSAALENGNFNRVPVIAGWNRDEVTWQVAMAELGRGRPASEEDLRKYARSRTGNGDPLRTEEILQRYSPEAYGSPSLAAAYMLTDSGLVCPTRRMLNTLTHNVPVYAYEFADKDAPQFNPPVSFQYRAAHTSELQYLFPGFHGASGIHQSLSPDQLFLAAQMQEMWTNFAREARPTPVDNPPQWQIYDPEQDNILVLDTDSIRMESQPYNTWRNCDFWNEVPVP